MYLPAFSGKLELFLEKVDDLESEVRVLVGPQSPMPHLERTRSAIEKILDSTDDREKLISLILVLVGTWMIDHGNAMWTVGPVEGSDLDIRVGIGVEVIDPPSYLGLLSLIEPIVDGKGNRDESINLLVGFSRNALGDWRTIQCTNSTQTG